MGEKGAANKQRCILITGAAGFVGRNLTAQLREDGYSNLRLYDVNCEAQQLLDWAGEADFVFHLAGVNRPQNPEEFYSGNADLTTRLLALLKNAERGASVLFSSTAQAGNGSDYAKSKEAAEDAVFRYALETGAPVYAYRLPGLFGKWSRPNYNSVVATFCSNIARGEPITVRDPDFSLPLCYIDDVVAGFIGALEGRVQPSEPKGFLEISPVHSTTLGALAALIEGFRQSRETLAAPPVGDEFARKLYATYLSYLPEEDFAYELRGNEDVRGSFTEFMRSEMSGQMSVNVAKPGIVKGNHWHNTKNEKFLVVSGEAVIRFRRLGDERVIEYPVSGEKLTVVDIPTGYTHNIENVGEGDLVTLMWASEPFNPDAPDTYFQEV